LDQDGQRSDPGDSSGRGSNGPRRSGPWTPEGIIRTADAAERDAATEAAAETASGPPIPSLIELADPASRSPIANTCPFFRALGPNGELGLPIEAPHPNNRCAAVGEPKPQSGRQQELVCLTAGHINCPRYLRGALVPGEAPVRVPVRRTPSSPVVASVLVLVMAASVSVGFLLVRGGITLPLPPPDPSEVAVASVPIVPVPSPSVSSSVPTASVPPSATPVASPTPPPTPAVTPAPATPVPTPRATSDRYQLLTPCPGTPNCWIYVVRSGDNLRSIANYFGVPYETVLDMNPQIHDPTTIRAGDEIRLPPPTR
jgi:LysM repeat protein